MKQVHDPRYRSWLHFLSDTRCFQMYEFDVALGSVLAQP